MLRIHGQGEGIYAFNLTEDGKAALDAWKRISW